MVDLIQLGKIAGLAGIALGIVFLLFRDVISSELAKTLGPANAYRLLRLIVISSFLVGVLGLGTYIWQQSRREQFVIPGGTGWIFAGYFDPGSNSWTKDVYVEHDGAPCDKSWIGDTVEIINRERHVVIVGYAATAFQRNLESPVTDYNEKRDITETRVPIGAKLIVRDVSAGRYPNRPAACWLRVAVS